jgi:lipoprotein-anchoring transpeptidase ErfK/SrfK
MRPGGILLALAVIIVGGAACAAETAAPSPTFVSAEAMLPAAEAAPLSAVFARIDVSDQTMNVYVDDRLTYTFKVSTARRGYITPAGFYGVEWLSPKHRSRKYDNAPMPWAVFFHGGYAVHGTTDIRNLGRPASHGCVRLHPDNAKTFFSLVKQIGMENTQIVVVN